MTSTQRLMANNANVLRNAILSPSSVRPIAGAVLSLARSRKGSGSVSLSGTYAGAEQADYDFEVIDANANDFAIVSSPVFTGAGSGSISSITWAGAAQEFRVTLADLGQVTTSAGTDLEGSSIVARTPGSPGNSIRFTVDPSPMAYAKTDYSLLTALKAGDDTVAGPQWDWDTKVMGPDNLIPVDAHRVAFGVDGTVYVQYKVYKDGDWSYHFEPALARDVAVGTAVKFVSGGRIVTITDGTTNEMYENIVTLYDLLDGIQNGSAPVKVSGVVAYDRAPGGMAARDMITRTDAHALPSYGSGSTYALGFSDVSVGGNASTEMVQARCWAVAQSVSANAGLGRELWQLVGSVSGLLGNIQTDQLYQHPDGKFALRIPSRLPDGYGQSRGRFTQVSTAFASRASAEDIRPSICVAAMALGPEAIDQTVTLVYTKRQTDCLCADMPAPDLSGAFCLLGIAGGVNAMGYTPDTVTRLTAMYDWGAGVVAGNSYYIAGLASPEFFIPDLRKAMGEFESVLAKVEANPAGETAWDTALADFKSDVETGLGNSGEMAVQTAMIGGGTLQSPTEIKRGQFVAREVAFDGTVYLIPSISSLADGYALEAGVGGQTIQYQPIGGAVVFDRHRSRLDWVLISAGISPLGKSDASTVDGGDGCWRDEGAAYFWTVTGSSGGCYAPAFTGIPYFSSREVCGIKGAFRSTHEFAFQINVKCEDSLKEGDTVTLSIGDAGWPSTYQTGDMLYLPIIAGQPLYLAGGADGNNVQTWYVEGSVTGALDSYALDTGALVPYSAGGLGFRIDPGAIAFQVGDGFAWSIEGGHWHWRKDGGAWSAPAPIANSAVAIDSGLSALFSTGAAPSFVAGDGYSFRALQPNAISNAIDPGPTAWRWVGSDVSLVADLGGVKSIDSAMIAFHSLPAGATVTLSGGADGVTWDWSEDIPWRSGAMAAFWDAHDAAHLKLDIAGSADGSVGWVWAGTAFSTGLSAVVALHRDYALSRAAGLLPSAAFQGAAMSGSVEWDEASLSEAEKAGLVAVLDWLKINDDEPMVIVPQVARPDEAYPVRVVDDQVELSEMTNYQARDANHRNYAVKLGLKGVPA